jgi:hypothetical protein
LNSVATEWRRHVGLIARNAVQRLGEYDIELAALGSGAH